jgi:hypothetical protein
MEINAVGKILRMELRPRADFLADASIAQEEARGTKLQRQIARNLAQYRSMRGLSQIACPPVGR